MKALVALCSLVLVTACMPLTRPAPVEVPVASAAPTVAEASRLGGEQAAAELTAWYDNLVTDCGGPSLPPSLCSGVMLRATENNQAFLPWDPSPASIEKGGVSFSWLRLDNNFARLAYHFNNGFIFYPSFYTPEGKNRAVTIAELCVFPHDANSNDRPTLQGCGANAEYPEESRPCADQGIRTAVQWLAKFNVGEDRYDFQCGWDIRSGGHDQAAHFMAAIGARNGIEDYVWRAQNEFRLATWRPGTGGTLPIHSFFYVDVDEAARGYAQNDQLRYYLAFGVVIPVIRLHLPPVRTERATFAYDPADQLDPSELHFDTSHITRGGTTYIISKRQDILPPFGSDNSVTRVARGGQPPYTYRSSDPSVAVVNAMGQVTPRANGTASITVTDSVGASAAYGVTFTGVIQVDYVGKLDHGQARTTVATRGERLPTHADLSRLQLDFASRWPYPPEYYWSSQSCPTGKYVSYYIHLVTSTGRCASGIEPQETIGLKGS